MYEESQPETTTGLLRHQESLREVIESISSELELRPLLTRIVRHACDLLGADNGAIGLVDFQRKLIRTEAIYCMPDCELGAEMPPGVGLAGHVYQSRQPIVLERYGDIRIPTLPELSVNAVIGVPIFWHDELIGFFGLGSAPPRKFSHNDVETLAIFAKHAAIAIQNARLFDGMQAALSEMQLLYETSRRLSVATTIEEVAAAYLEQIATRQKYACTIVLYEKSGIGQKTGVVTHGSWTPVEGICLSVTRAPYSRDELDEPLDRGETVTISDVHTDPRVPESLRAIQLRSGRPSLAFIPLMAREERIGLVALSYREPDAWNSADLRPYQATAAQLALALDSRRQRLLSEERGQQVAVLEERHRIARELHDSITQLLFSMTLIAQTIAPSWRRNPEEGEARVQRMLELSQSALTEMRSLLAKLRPHELTGPEPALEEPSGSERIRRDGLLAALRRHCGGLITEGLTVALEVQEYPGLSPELEEALLRIAQEALHNVIKHSGAGRALVRLSAGEGGVLLEVIDHGAGMAMADQSGAPKSGLGLATMRERAEAVCGDLVVESSPGKGTIVRVSIPVSGKDSE